MHLAWSLRHACRGPAVAQRLTRAYSQQATASALKESWHVEKDMPMHSRRPTNAGDQRPMKVPKLATNQSPSTSSRDYSDKSGVVSPPFTIPPVSSKSKSHLSPLPPGFSHKSSGRKGKGQTRETSLLKSRFKSRYESLPEFEGPMHDAVYVEAQHRTSIGSRPEIKPALADNPKSPVMNFVLAHFGSDYALQFEFKEYFDSSTNRPVVR